MFIKKGLYWKYISPDQQALIDQGSYILDDLGKHIPVRPITDYSFVVFPFAKAYEGFLKKLFLDMGLIKEWQYNSDHFRIGKTLSPYLVKRLKKSSVYKRLSDRLGSTTLADELWQVWKRGRN